MLRHNISAITMCCFIWLSGCKKEPSDTDRVIQLKAFVDSRFIPAMIAQDKSHSTARGEWSGKSQSVDAVMINSTTHPKVFRVEFEEGVFNVEDDKYPFEKYQADFIPTSTPPGWELVRVEKDGKALSTEYFSQFVR